MSRLPFELLLAFRYLRPKRTFVSAITLISVVGVMLGVAVLIVVLGVMSGFDRQLREKILGFNPHLRVLQDEPMANYALPMRIIATNRLVKGVAPYVVGQVLLETQPSVGSPMEASPVVRGIEPRFEKRWSLLSRKMIAGKFDLSANDLLIGSEFAQMLHLQVGDHVAIYTANDFRKMLHQSKKGRTEVALPEDYVVRGIFDVGYYEYNASVVVCSLMNAQDFFDMGNHVNGLMVMLKDPSPANTRAAQEELEAALGPGYRVISWMQENSSILNALVVEKNVMFYLLFFIMIVAAFGITSGLITFVVQKTREIGTLKALGATKGQVMVLFLGQSLLVGVLGVLSGLGLGLVALVYRNEFLHFMNRLTGFQLFPASVYNFTELPAMVIPRDLLLICGGSLAICLVAGFLPAWNAGRLHPVEALRHE